MSAMRIISRRRLAGYVADRLKAGDKNVIKQLAAYLIETDNERAVDVVVRDIEAALARRGTVVADVVTATKLTEDLKAAVAALLDTNDLHVRETIDPSVLGGVRVEATGRRYDATMRRRIEKLKTMSAKKGAK